MGDDSIKEGIRRYIIPFSAVFFAAAVIFRPELVASVIGGIWSAAAPIIAGILLAAVIDPAVIRMETGLTKLFSRSSMKRTRCAALVIVYLLIAAVLAAVIMIIIPQLARSVRLFVNSFDSYYMSLRAELESLEGSFIMELFGRFDSLLEVLSVQLPELFKRTFSVAGGFIRSCANIVVGLVLSVYILASKEQLVGFISCAAKGFMSENGYRRTSKIFSAVYFSLVSFISGQLTEAVILGTLCFAGMVIFGFAYPLLISTIIGVTALVPVVGAFAGAIPAVFVLFLVKPSSALWFAVFIIILQQLENNLIYPKVVGRSVGLPPLLVLTAIIIGAQLGGTVGIMTGIPLLSAAYFLIKEKLENEGNTDEM